jgi:hypothetical protein
MIGSWWPFSLVQLSASAVSTVSLPQIHNSYCRSSAVILVHRCHLCMVCSEPAVPPSRWFWNFWAWFVDGQPPHTRTQHPPPLSHQTCAAPR